MKREQVISADAMTGELDVWTAVDAKARFSELLERAAHEGPQQVTWRGRPCAVVVSVDDWRGGSGGRRGVLEALLMAGQESFSLGEESLARLFPRLAQTAADGSAAA